MQAELINGEARVNLSAATILLLERSLQGMDILSQVVAGFGARHLLRCSSIDEAQTIVRGTAIDLVIMDPGVDGDRGFEFLNWLRRARLKPNSFAPVLVVSGHTQVSRVKVARDAGANFMIAKPLVPKVLLERILWVARISRPFIETDRYNGPDRRFKYEGPPIGEEGRRADDLTTEVGVATAPNMSQNEVDSLVQPQRVTL